MLDSSLKFVSPTSFIKTLQRVVTRLSTKRVFEKERLGWNLDGRETAARGDSEAVIAMVGGKMGGGGGLRPGRAFWAVARQRERHGDGRWDS